MTLTASPRCSRRSPPSPCSSSQESARGGEAFYSISMQPSLRRLQMNVANVIPLSASHAVPYAKSGDPATPNPVRVRFDRFELDEANARLLRDGTPVAVAPTPFGVLCALARQPGSLLSTNALLDQVWGHQYVTDSVLRTAISELRTALDDDARKPRFIETVSRRGYRFIA